MTAPEVSPTAEHIDAVAKVAADYVGAGEYPSDPHGPNCYDVARRCECASDIAADILTSTDAAVHAAMLDALVRAGVLTEERAPISRGMEHHHWQQRWDGEHTHEGRRFVTPWEVAE